MGYYNPAEQVTNAYPFPFELREDQKRDVDALVDYERVGIFNGLGTGKTAVSTAIALHWGLDDLTDQIVILLPPILIRQWEQWLKNFDLGITIYQGTPTKRKQLSLDNDVILTSIGVWKNDFERFKTGLGDKRVTLIVDEAACVRSPATQNFKSIREFVELSDKRLILMTATPLGSVPTSCYGLIKLKSPTIYPSHRSFRVIVKSGVWDN
ncbi:DEAD/DEAH box helicase family protein [Desulfurivibrio alkaliphilus]|uniref:DEAD/DEAH box helicase family protein n=1 Tax=Desulfurivibrio alkaliphilus TaxID=427923 RepID=UPI0005A0C63B|nr:DEAD/DEAH box helicase family protein [Desulfurivibrio alkaliphilus]